MKASRKNKLVDERISNNINEESSFDHFELVNEKLQDYTETLFELSP